MAINNIYAEITGPADTVTLDATHNGNSGWGATVRLYDSSGSYTDVNTNDVIYTDSSFPETPILVGRTQMIVTQMSNKSTLRV